MNNISYIIFGFDKCKVHYKSLRNMTNSVGRDVDPVGQPMLLSVVIELGSEQLTVCVVGGGVGGQPFHC